MMEKLFLIKYFEKWPKALMHVYTLLFVMLGWVIFACDDISLLANYMSSMFGFNGFINGMTLYYLKTYGILFIVLIIGSTSLPARMLKSLAAKANIIAKKEFLMEFSFAVLIIFSSIVLLIGDSYNPFLYFRF